MPVKNVKPLGRKYGRLTVVSEETRNSRRTAIVNCTCGKQKRVLVDALLAGRTSSCGSYACKYGPAPKPVKDYHPTGSRSIPLPTLRKIWKAHTRERKPMLIAELADKYGIKSHNTLYSTLRAIRRCGGIEPYAAKIKEPRK